MKGAGVTGPVQLKGLKNGSTADLSSQQWTYQVSFFNIVSKVANMLVGGTTSYFIGIDLVCNVKCRLV